MPAVFTYVDDFEHFMKRQMGRLRRKPAHAPVKTEVSDPVK